MPRKLIKFDVDALLSNLLLYLILSGYIATVYTAALAAVLVAGLVPYEDPRIIFGPPWWVNIVIIIVVALTLLPVRRWLQSRINALIYGQHDDPYALISKVNQHLQAMTSPQMTLPVVAETIALTLKLPYVAIKTQNTGTSLQIEFGRQPARAEMTTLPLVYLDKPLGELQVASRRANEALSGSDLELLRDVSRQIGIALHAAQLTAALQASRERLVIAREEERRRLRRDLHDDLAPMLAGLALTASSIADVIPIDPAKAATLANDLNHSIRAAVNNIRRLVYDLRPPTLDELGLVAAIHERAAQFTHSGEGLRVIVEADELPSLPAAVEVAAYRIAQEALMNVARHAQAKACHIRLALDDDCLQLEITDDGLGLTETRTPGVGLRSMQERAAELGGTCVIEAAPDGGTKVMAKLPISRD
jgi:signal transduction histidine kinase